MRSVGTLLIISLFFAILPGSRSASAQGTADLAITLSPSASPVTADTDLTYTIRVTNAGPDVAEHSIVVDTPPADVIFRSASGVGTYSTATNRVTWPVGSIGPGATVVLQLVITPIHPAPGGITNQAQANTASVDPTSPNLAKTNTSVRAELGVQYVSVRDTEMKPSFRNVPLGSTLQWDFFGPGVHEITDSHGLGIFDSGPMSPVSYFRYTFDLSAEIRTMDIGYPDNNGKIVVPIQVTPASGTSTTQFAVTWATAPLPAGIVEDVQIKRPNVSRWRSYTRGTTLLGDGFTPDAGAGTYEFRDRVRSTTDGVYSRFGPPVAIAVTG
jgi:uncharacterized repeat protein (TIGR01451 family)